MIQGVHVAAARVANLLNLLPVNLVGNAKRQIVYLSSADLIDRSSGEPIATPPNA